MPCELRWHSFQFQEMKISGMMLSITILQKELKIFLQLLKLVNYYLNNFITFSRRQLVHFSNYKNYAKNMLSDTILEVVFFSRNKESFFSFLPAFFHNLTSILNPSPHLGPFFQADTELIQPEQHFQESAADYKNKLFFSVLPEVYEIN